MQVVSYAVVTPTTGSSIDPGVWKVRLNNVGAGLQPGLKNNYTLLFAADPPAATLAWSAPQDLSPTSKRLLWTASRGGAALNPDLEVEFFALPAVQKPVTPTLMAGTTIVQKRSAMSGQYDWDLSGLAAGTYAFGARIDDHATGNGHVVVWSPYTVTLVDVTPPPVPALAGQLAYTDTLVVYWNRDDATPDLAGYLVEYTVPDWDLAAPIAKVRRVLPTKKSESPVVERVRLGGLTLSQQQPIVTTVCVRSYDASGNVSACVPAEITMPEAPDETAGPPGHPGGRQRRHRHHGELGAAGLRTLGGIGGGLSPGRLPGAAVGSARIRGSIAADLPRQQPEHATDRADAGPGLRGGSARAGGERGGRPANLGASHAHQPV